MFEIGSTLREARTRQGLGIDEMEQRTKVRARYLRFLEEERFELLPGHTYTKGFLRAYAEALGLEGKPFVDEYTSRYVAAAAEEVAQRRPLARGSAEPYRRHRRPSDPRESRTVVFVLVLVVLVTALVIGAWRFGGEEAPSVPGLGTVVNSAAVSPDVVAGSPLGASVAAR